MDPNKHNALHYHETSVKPARAPHWRAIPQGTWVKDRSFWARRALDSHIYDALVDKKGGIYFWHDGDGWHAYDAPNVETIEEAKAYAAVLLRLQEPPATTD